MCSGWLLLDMHSAGTRCRSRDEWLFLWNVDGSTDIDTTVLFKKDEFLHSLTEDCDREQHAPINCSKARSFGDILSTSCTAGDTCREVTFTSASSSVAWAHLVIFPEDPAVPVRTLCGVRRKGWGRHEVDHLLFLGERRGRVLFPANSWPTPFLG